jgi:tetratricopeptide (TPR) repeat protein
MPLKSISLAIPWLSCVHRNHEMNASDREATALNDRGNALFDKGRIAEAIDCYRQAVRKAPDYADAHNNLGIALAGQGQIAEAIDCFRRALRANPNYANALNNLGNALKDQPAEAEECFRRALLINPHHTQAHNNLGIVLVGQGRTAEAIDCFRRALGVHPHYASAWNNLGAALKGQGQQAEAEECFRRALRIQPNHVDALNNLGLGLREQGRLAEAALCHRQVLRINPCDADTHYHLGCALAGQGELAEATVCYQRTLQYKPDHADAHSNLGLAIKDQGRPAEAEQHFQRALRIDPDHKSARWNLCFARLMQGDLEGGWRDYDLRWEQPGMAPRSFGEPRWDGSSLEGKTILVYAEQGLGDTIQFLRYLPWLEQCGGRVVFECQPQLELLLTGTLGAALVVPAGAPLPSFDVQIPLLSLPGLFQTTLATIPTPLSCLNPEPALVQRWRQELEPLAGFKVGIAWQGNPKHPADRFRSASLANFEALANVPGVQLVSLQKGQGVDQLRSLAAQFPVLDLSERFDVTGAFMDTAAMMKCLDLVVTVDSALAHLAGTLGVPVWVALHIAPDWRWLMERFDSPWYPTMRLFRQSRPGDWREVFERMAVALRGWVENQNVDATSLAPSPEARI